MDAKRAVLYARVSKRSLDNVRHLFEQLTMCREYAAACGYLVVAELVEDEHGVSGASFELEQLDKASEMARNREFDVLVVRDLDRLSRNLAKHLVIEEELKHSGVQIEYVLEEFGDTLEDNLRKSYRASEAESEREKIKERMIRGRRLKVKAGSVLLHGQEIYGYQAVEQDGKWTLQVYEPEAEIIRLICTWYAVGDGVSGPKSLMGIIRQLGEMQAPTFADTHDTSHKKKRGYGQWSRASVHRILTNETYAGVWRYGKHTLLNDTRTRNPDAYALIVHVPPIITRTVWDIVQARLARNKQSLVHQPKYAYLVARRTICGRCGGKMVAFANSTNRKPYLYYRCPASYGAYATICDMLSFRALHVDTVVWQWIRAFLTNPAILETRLQAYQIEAQQVQLPSYGRLKVIADLLADNQSQLERLLDLYLSGEFPKDILVERKARLERMVKSLEQERSELSTRLETCTSSQGQMQVLWGIVRQGLDSIDADFDQQRQLIELLNVQVTLDIRDGQKVVHARCILGATELVIPPSRGKM